MWKTNGETKTCPIYVPINQMNLVTHQGLCADFRARMFQAKRHSQDQVEVSYNLVNMFNSPINWIQKLHAFFTVFEVYIMVIAVPVPILVLAFQDLLKIIPKSDLDDGSTFFIFSNLNTLILLIGFAIYEVFKRRAAKNLYKSETLPLVYALQTPLLQLPAAILFGFFPMISASFSLLRDKVTFAVTPKIRLEKSTN